MGEQAPSAGRLVDHGARLRYLLVGEQPPGLVVERRSREQRHLGVAVEEDLLQVVLELVALQGHRHILEHAGVPVLGGVLAEVEQPLLVEVVAHEVRLVVEDELALEPLGAGVGHVLVAASASETSHTGPNTSFMARNAVAMPDADLRKLRRLTLSRLA